jgi:glycosyltransferase involved in cell wall biosynthesis
MNPQKKNTLLLDALSQTIVNPTASHRWHTLGERYGLDGDIEARKFVHETLLANVRKEGVEGLLLTTFMAAVTDDMTYTEEAAEIILKIRPFDPERLMAFALYEWSRIIGKSANRTEFVTKLRQARAPEMLQIVGSYVNANAPYLQPRPINSIRKVALIVPYVGIAFQSVPTSMAFQQARLLIELGIEVHLFSAQELRIQQMQHYLGDDARVRVNEPDITVLQNIIPKGVAVTLCDERFSLMRRWHDIYEKVAEFDPDLVLFVGLNSPILTPLYASRPVLGLCVHSTSPMAPVDVWLTANKSLADRLSNDWGAAFPDAWGHYHPYRINLNPLQAPISRAQLNLKPQDLVMVSVGARLESEIQTEWATEIIGILKTYPTAVLLLVGGTGTLPPALSNAPAAQIRLLSQHDDVRSVFKICDVYVNPLRIGGGFSVAEAMAEGLPTLALNGSDGGNKLGDHASETLAEYFDKLRSLIIDRQLRQKIGASMRSLFSNTLDINRSGTSLMAACNLTRERYKLRTFTKD